MVFSSMIFLWVFLPLCLLVYNVSPVKVKNIVLLIFSLGFYAWGEPKFIIIMLISIGINYVAGLVLDKATTKNQMKSVVFIGVLLNLGILGYFKYFNFAIQNIEALLNMEISAKTIILPIGISFYTFQSMSYLIDIYRLKRETGEQVAERNVLNLALYVSLFPQLIAGPIVKYHEVQNQIRKRNVSVDDFAYGIKRFIYGLAKKVIISNTMAQTADAIFAIDVNQLTTPLGWLAVSCYTIQIYFDFSGYSDMAIGLGRMFGFKFLENFNYPYLSKSIQEFWRRWHISLSTWFKEYLYIPLGGSKNNKKWKTYRNLGLVFLATGIWHGANWTFVAWGVFHGFFIVVERLFLGEKLKNNKYKVINHIYTMGVVIVGWMLFRAESISYFFELIKVMFRWDVNPVQTVGMYADNFTWFVLGVGILFSGIIQAMSVKLKNQLYSERVNWLELFVLVIMFSVCCTFLANNSYNPFIYFRF